MRRTLPLPRRAPELVSHTLRVSEIPPELTLAADGQYFPDLYHAAFLQNFVAQPTETLVKQPIERRKKLTSSLQNFSRQALRSIGGIGTARHYVRLRVINRSMPSFSLLDS